MAINKYFFIFFASFLVIFNPFIALATEPEPPDGIKLFINADKVVPLADSILVNLSGQVADSYIYQVDNAMLSIALPRIGKLDSEEVLLWESSVNGNAKFDLDYNITGLEVGTYVVKANLTIFPQNVSRSSHLYIKVSDYGVFSSSVSLGTAQIIELKEEAKRRGYENLTNEELKIAAPDLYKRMSAVVTQKLVPVTR